MGRYDKIRYFNGTSWIQPSQIKVHNGSTWVDYGTNLSYNTNSITAYTDTVNQNLMARYPFDADANDASGNGRHLTNSGATLAAGYTGNSYSFNGTSNYMYRTTTDFNRVNGQELTVSCWIKPGRTAGQYQEIIANRDATNYNWMLYQHVTDGSIQLHGSAQNKSSYIPTAGAWVHIVATVEWNGTYKLYANGTLQQTVTGYTFGNPVTQLSIGYFPNTEYYLGSIDEVRIYNRALAQSEVTSLYNLTAPIVPLRFSRNRQDYTTYSTSAKYFPSAIFGTGTGLTLTSGEWTWTTRRQVGTSWDAWLWMMVDNSLTSYGWAGTTLNNDSTEDWHTLTWTTPRWIEKVRFATCNSTKFGSTPYRVEASFRNADGSWTAEATYSIATNSYTVGSAWGTNYFIFNKQSSAGYTGFKLRYLNNATYHTDLAATRIGEMEVWLGTITNGSNWI